MLQKEATVPMTSLDGVSWGISLEKGEAIKVEPSGRLHGMGAPHEKVRQFPPLLGTNNQPLALQPPWVLVSLSVNGGGIESTKHKPSLSNTEATCHMWLWNL